MRRGPGLLICWIVANLAGLAVFLTWAASCCWIEPEIRAIPGASAGDAFVWWFGPFRLLAAYALANLGWSAIMAARAILTHRLRPLVAPACVLAAWAAAFVVDNLHHGA